MVNSELPALIFKKGNILPIKCIYWCRKILRSDCDYFFNKNQRFYFCNKQAVCFLCDWK
jgi:hypothetical protein